MSNYVLVHMSGVHCHVCASSASDCACMYLTVQYSTVVQYLYFKSWMSSSKHKNSNDVAGTETSLEPGNFCCRTGMFAPGHAS